MADPTFSGAPPSPADDKVGLVLQERYRIIRKLGEGGMGSVYEARHELIGKKVAVKTLNPAFAKDPGLVERFRREARAATAAGNAHIIDVTDLGTLPDGSPFLVMEYLEGTEFGDLLAREGALPVGRAVHILSQVCDALGAAHGKGIVHRDLKPENIYLIHLQGDPDFVKVLDFGISKMQEAKEGVKSLTQTGTALGTPHYMSPEQAQGLATTDHRADIYALGVILYYALSGTVPFDADSYAALVLKIFQEVPKPLVELRSDIPPELDALVQRCLAKKPEDRFASVQELERALRPFRDLTGKATMVEFAPTDPPPAPGAASPAAAARTVAGSHTDPKAVGPSTGSNTAGNATGITLPETSRRGL
ncbi:MAG: serine/threonine protein kinase, partial [Myxococcales bacterium]|nr:serine/threonine protein kinase [Myxococcales bacterium]